MKSPHLRNFLIIVFCVLASGAMLWATRLAFAPPPPETLAATPNRTVATEQEWIVGDVVAAIAGMARNASTVDVKVKRGIDAGGHASFDVALPGEHQQVTVVSHIWSPDTYEPIAQHLLGDGAAVNDDVDLAARDALTDLRVDVLLAQNRRISDALQANMRSASAHESAALLVGAFALREASNFFGDVRPALSRMAAHLAMARTLRRGEPIGHDGALAMVILTDLSGLQRQALEMLDAYDGVAAPGSPDRAWMRALRLRITGDWRQHHADEHETLLERFEYARALRQRLGADAFVAYADTADAGAVNLPDWHRIALDNSEITLEAGARFAATGMLRELDEAQHVWTALHGDSLGRDALVSALNDRPLASPVSRRGGATHVDVLDWGTWAAFHQRHLCESLALIVLHVRNSEGDRAVGRTLKELDASFGQLTLFPVVEGWIARNSEQYEDALMRARPIVDAQPELLTAPEWNFLLKRPSFERRTIPFPVNVRWFDPAEPEGTAFDLPNRSLQPGCPRPPTLEQAAWFAREQPYDEWTVWANAWYPVKGRPTADAIRAAFGPLIEYDDIALRNFVDQIALTLDERVELVQRRCAIAPHNCGTLAELLLVNNREREAVAAYEHWAASERNQAIVAWNVTWLVRYYRDHGRLADARTVAAAAAATRSYGGLQVMAELLEMEGRLDEAEKIYRDIAGQYQDGNAPLGLFLMRRALSTHDKALEEKAAGLLRDEFPNGLEPIVEYALPATPADGATFATFGLRPASFGLQPDDIIVGVDGWRVHSGTQYTEVSRLSFSDSIALLVWRKGEYVHVLARVPQRWFGVRFNDYERE